MTIGMETIYEGMLDKKIDRILYGHGVIYLRNSAAGTSYIISSSDMQLIGFGPSKLVERK